MNFLPVGMMFGLMHTANAPLHQAILDFETSPIMRDIINYFLVFFRSQLGQHFDSVSVCLTNYYAVDLP